MRNTVTWHNKMSSYIFYFAGYKLINQREGSVNGRAIELQTLYLAFSTYVTSVNSKNSSRSSSEELIQIYIQSTTSHHNSSSKMETDFHIQRFTCAVHADMFCWHHLTSLHVAWIYAVCVQRLFIKYNYPKWRLKATWNENMQVNCSFLI